MSETPASSTAIPSPAAEIQVKLGIDPQQRVVQVAAKRRLALDGIEFVLSFATIKSLAAQILAMEASAELRDQANRSLLMRS